MRPELQGYDWVLEWNGYKAVAPTEALCIRVFEEMLLVNARLEIMKRKKDAVTSIGEIKKFPHPVFRDNE